MANRVKFTFFPARWSVRSRQLAWFASELAIMAERFSYAILGRGAWAGKIQSILDAEQRPVTFLAHTRRNASESEAAYPVIVRPAWPTRCIKEDGRDWGEYTGDREKAMALFESRDRILGGFRRK